VDEEITLDECDTYSFNPDPDNNPFEEEGKCSCCVLFVFICGFILFELYLMP
jgi:hypothetical protein